MAYRAQVRLEEARNLQTRIAVVPRLPGLTAVAWEPEMTAAAKPAGAPLLAERDVAVVVRQEDMPHREKEIAVADRARGSLVEVCLNGRMPAASVPAKEKHPRACFLQILAAVVAADTAAAVVAVVAADTAVAVAA